jgi:hypothetical protein
LSSQILPSPSMALLDSTFIFPVLKKDSL